MYWPVLLSSPTTSGSPPVLSISLSDHSFSALASSFACTLVHSRPLWRFMFFSKRALNAPSISSRCFFERVTFDIVSATTQLEVNCSILLGRFLRNKPSNDMAFPHPQSRKEQ